MQHQFDMMGCPTNNRPACQIASLHAGPEKSVAATKSFICSLSAIAHLMAAWSQNEDLMKELDNLPDALEKAFALDWSRGIEKLKDAGNLFVISRGFGLGIAQEAALKFKETCGLHAEAFSAAEVKHGPMTIIKKGFPVLIFSLQDQTQPSIDDAATAFIERSAQVFAAGNPVTVPITLTRPLARPPNCALSFLFSPFTNSSIYFHWRVAIIPTAHPI